MVNPKRLLLVAIAILATVPLSGEWACERNMRALFSAADMVVVGRAASPREGTAWGRTTSIDLRVIQSFRSGSSLHLRTGSHVNVWVVHSSTACCFSKFEGEKTFLVFASLNPESGLLETDHCRVFSPDDFEVLVRRQPREILDVDFRWWKTW